MKQLDLPEALATWDRPLSRLSGGERIKLQLARLLTAQPDILLLDEPSNDLDLTALGILEHFLSTWPGAALFVSHDETLIRNTANVIVHLEAFDAGKAAPRATRTPAYPTISTSRTASQIPPSGSGLPPGAR